MTIPDLSFNIQLLICRSALYCEPARLSTARRKGNFSGSLYDGRKISFTENVFYEFREVKIVRVWSVIDKMAIEAQLHTSISA